MKAYFTRLIIIKFKEVIPLIRLIFFLIMPSFTTRAARKNAGKKGDEGRSFSATAEEGKAVKIFLTDTPQYITVPELRTPAKVVDKLRRDFGNLKEFNRNSMKIGIRKILNQKDVVQSVNQFWGGGTDKALLGSELEDHVVSTTR